MTCRVLLDNPVFKAAAFGTTARQRQRHKWGHSYVEADIVGYTRKPDVQPDQKWRREQVLCLPTIARLAREGRLILFDSYELGVERGRGRGEPTDFGNDLSGIDIRGVLQPVERSKFHATADIHAYFSKKTMVQCCETLLHFDQNVHLHRFLEVKPNYFSEFEIMNLKNIRIFKKLCHHMHNSHYPDACHLWSAEVNAIDFFLTLDRKFLNIISRVKAIPIKCRAISPTELLKELDVAELDSVPLEHGVFYNYYDPWPRATSRGLKIPTK